MQTVLQPIRSLTEIRKNWLNYKEKWKGKIYGIFLYTEADKEFKLFIEENFWDLNDLSGNDSLLFVITELPDEIEYKYPDTDEEIDGHCEIIAIKERSENDVYNIAKRLNIVDALPCLILYKDCPNDEELKNSICVSFKERKANITEFRKIFSKIKSSRNNIENLKEIKRLLIKEKIWKLIKNPNLYSCIGNLLNSFD